MREWKSGLRNGFFNFRFKQVSYRISFINLNWKQSYKIKVTFCIFNTSLAAMLSVHFLITAINQSGCRITENIIIVPFLKPYPSKSTKLSFLLL